MSLIRTPVSLKVPARIAAVFWAIKLLTTAFGESTSDYLVHNVNPYLAVVGGFIVFAIAMALQLRTDRYVPWVYWLAVAMVAVFGTMAADVLHVEFHVPYLVSSILFALLLTGVFWAWSRVEPTLSIHSITTTRRELYYWAAVLATFAMGTALGDLAAYTLKLGFLSAGVVFAVLFALPGLAFGALRVNAILAFWAAYVMTRPLGASFADWTGKSRTLGGIGIGDGPVGFVLAALIVALVAYLTITRADQGDEQAVPTLEPALGEDAI
ncbi:MAG: COG4705 family protein [Gaiellaceae bacterium]